jgi:hypothetical protein
LYNNLLNNITFKKSVIYLDKTADGGNAFESDENLTSRFFSLSFIFFGGWGGGKSYLTPKFSSYLNLVIGFSILRIMSLNFIQVLNWSPDHFTVKEQFSICYVCLI